MKTPRGNLDRALLSLAVGASLLAGCGGGGGGTVAVPKITIQPKAQTVAAGSAATFGVAASGKGLSYQWHHVDAGGTDAFVSGGTSASLTIASVSSADAGGYYVVVTGSAGAATSDLATLTVTDPSSTGGATVTVG